jgi:hypothetical protein
MLETYSDFRRWFNETYGYLSFSMSDFYVGEMGTLRFDVLHNNNVSDLNNLNIDKILDFIGGDSEMSELLFDALFRQNGYRVDNDFTPLKQVKEFKL